MEGALPWTLGGLQWLLRIAVQASVLIAFVLLVQRVLRSRVSPAWRHGLWLLVVARLALPFSLESRASIFNWLRLNTPALASQPPRPAVPVALTAPALRAVAGSGPNAGAAPLLPPAAGFKSERFPARGTLVLGDPSVSQTRFGLERPRRAWMLWFAAIWLAGALVLSARVLVESIRLQRSIAPKRLVTDSAVLELLEDCKQLMGVQVPVVLVQTDLVSSPVLYGFLRPRLLLPTGLLKEFSPGELRFVFLHELAHVRRHDIILSWLVTLLQVLHWFNPLVWFAFARMRVDRELACDALVLSRTSLGEQKAYGRTMLRLLEGFVRAARFPAMAGILEDPSQLATRLRCIADFKRRPRSPALALGAAFVLALAVLTDGRAHVIAQSFPVWPARLLTTRPAGETDIRSITVRPNDGVNLQRALTRGELCLAADSDTTNLLNQGYKVVGLVDGLGLDRWRRCGVGPAPYPRTAHSVVWTGRELLVWGGGVQNFFLNGGARFDPATDKWEPIATNCPLAGRWHHAAVWTGKEMIVWAGRASFASKFNFNDGAIYNPETDSWRLMNSDGAPAPRSQVCAVWTGRDFIVWGGRGDLDTSFNDGARYNPETDTWQRMADVSELQPRHNAPAVWTGEEMIIWGGSSWNGSNSYSFNTGGRYNPARDSWTLLPLAGAPRPRTKHTVVWTGTEVLTWGGVHYSDGEYFNDGASYDPVANRWTPLPQRGALSSRSAYLSGWTGTELVIWGGMTTNNECFNTGARFDPATGLWAPLSNENAPAPRMLMRPDAAVWTGAQLLVFGGYDFNTEFSTIHAWSPAPAMHLFQRAR